MTVMTDPLPGIRSCLTLNFLGELRGSFFASFAVKSFDFSLKQEPMTAKFAKKFRLSHYRRS
jgi:hypothetical protein